MRLSDGVLDVLQRMGELGPKMIKLSVSKSSHGRMERILIRDGYVITMDPSQKTLKRCSILIEGDRISAIGESIKGPADEKIDARRMAVLPGFINAHTHSPMTLLRGVGDDLELDTWLKTRIWPIEKKLGAEDCYIGALLACVEMIKSGTTCFADQYFFMERVAEAVGKSGIRGVLSYGIIELDIPGRCEEEMKKGEKLVKEYHGEFEGRVLTMFGPHAPYTCSSECLMKIKELARRYGVGVHIHLAETEKEVKEISQRYGKRPVEYLDSLGFLGPEVLAAHCVWLTGKEISLLVKNGVKPVHNPISNMKLASGISPVPEMLAERIPVALGTDGAASNNTLDMFEEMKVAALLHKVKKLDPTVMPARTLLRMATINGAVAVGMHAEIGSIEVGKKADLILVDLKNARFVPLHDVSSHLVYASRGEDVDTVIVDGKILMRKRKLLTLDENEIFEMAERAASKLVGSGDFMEQELWKLEEKLEKKLQKRSKKYRSLYRRSYKRGKR